MPLIEIRKTKGGGKIGLWYISESPEELMRMEVFPEEDIRILRSFSHEQRKKEWLAARILISQITGEKNCKINYDANGKPSADGLQNHISISHSRNLLVIVIDKKETGTDIELVKPNVLKIKEKFLSAEELNLFGNAGIEQLTLCWCVKESLYKLYGKKQLAFKQNIFIEPFKYTKKGNITGGIHINELKEKYILQYEEMVWNEKHYILTYIVNKL